MGGEKAEVGGRGAQLLCSWSSQAGLTQEAFPSVLQAALWGQAGHALPPAEGQLSEEPFHTALSL